MDNNLNNFNYELPPEKIARFPLKDRDQSKLLVYRENQIAHKSFFELPDQLKKNSLLVFNNTRVIPARLFFKKETGAIIEIFLLEPVSPYQDITQSMEVKEAATWKCMIGNLKKWKNAALVLKHNDLEITASFHDREKQEVNLQWNKDITFAELMNESGKIPLPPYMEREAMEEDKERYQTIYSKIKGAVAAPTAGLHFTDRIFRELNKQQIHTTELTLHVGAGTFQPVKDDDISKHIMHKEEIHITLNTLKQILQAKRIVAVGTTSMRTLESLYWYAKDLKNELKPLYVNQYQPYKKTNDLPSPRMIFQRLIELMEIEQITALSGETQLLIQPGYNFMVCDALITNFHLPKSTLILLVAAFIGNDWQKVYKEALEHDYRFLSYGDSSLLFKN